MKILLSILLFATAATQSLFSQTTTLAMPVNNTQTIQVPAGQVFELLTWSDTNGAINMSVDGVYITPIRTVPLQTVIAGPRTLSITTLSDRTLVFTYKLKVDSQVATQNIASQAVVIPSNATANADIIFESSPDLVNWTAAVAGSYAPSTANRFFRVRLVTH